MIKVKIKDVVKYGGHNLSANGIVNLTLKSDYSELVNTIELTQLLNNDIMLKTKLPDSKPMKLGMFKIKQIVINGDGESTLKFSGINDFIEMDNLNILPMNDSDTKQFIVMFESEVELEEQEGEGEDEGDEW